MCGLVGVAGDLRRPHIDAFNQLLFVNNLRGSHSTGVAGINRGGHTDVLKGVMMAHDLQNCKAYDGIVNQSKVALIGHGRHATIGDKTKWNAHPFDFDNVVGAHNGTIDYGALQRLGNRGKFGTDSECVYDHMNTHGVGDTVGLLSGAWALTFFDKNDGTINLMRNAERPLFFQYAEEMQVLFWASELWMLRGLLPRCGVKINPEMDKAYELTPDRHYKFEIPRLSHPFEHPKSSVLEGWKAGFTMGTPRGPTSHVPTGGTNVLSDAGRRAIEQGASGPIKSSPSSAGQRGTPLIVSTGASIGSSEKPDSANSNVVDLSVRRMSAKQQRKLAADKKKEQNRLKGGRFRPPYKDEAGQVIPKKYWDYLTDGGCPYCSTNAIWGRPVMFIDTRPSVFPRWVCHECLESPEAEDRIDLMQSMN